MRPINKEKIPSFFKRRVIGEIRLFASFFGSKGIKNKKQITKIIAVCFLLSAVALPASAFSLSSFSSPFGEGGFRGIYKSVSENVSETLENSYIYINNNINTAKNSIVSFVVLGGEQLVLVAEGVTEFAQNATQDSKEFFVDFAESTSESAKNIKNQVNSAFASLPDAFKGVSIAFSSMGEKAKEVPNFLARVAQGAGSGASEMGAKASDVIAGSASDAAISLQNIGTAISDTFWGGAYFLSDTGHNAKLALSSLPRAFSAVANSASNIATPLQSFGQELGNTPKNLALSVSVIARSVYSRDAAISFQNFGSSLGNTPKNLALSVSVIARSVYSRDAAIPLQTFGSSLGNTPKNLALSFTSSISNIQYPISVFGSSLGNTPKNLALSVSVIANSASNIATPLQSFGQELGNAPKNLASGLSSSIASPISKIASAIVSVPKAIKDGGVKTVRFAFDRAKQELPKDETAKADTIVLSPLQEEAGMGSTQEESSAILERHGDSTLSSDAENQAATAQQVPPLSVRGGQGELDTNPSQPPLAPRGGEGNLAFLSEASTAIQTATQETGTAIQTSTQDAITAIVAATQKTGTAVKTTTQEVGESLNDIFVEGPKIVAGATWDVLQYVGDTVVSWWDRAKLALLGRQLAVGPSSVPSPSSPPLEKGDTGGFNNEPLSEDGFINPPQPSFSKGGSEEGTQTIVRETTNTIYKIPSILGATTVDGSLTVNGNTILKGNKITIAAPVILENSLSIGSVFSIDHNTGQITSLGGLNIPYGKLVAKDIESSGTINFAGATIDFTGANITGFTTGGNTVINNFNTYHSGTGASVGGSFDALSVQQDATIGGSLAVSGGLTITGATALNSNVTIGDAASDTITINASSISIPNGITFSGGVVSFGSEVNTSSTFTGNISVNGTGTSTLLYGATFATSGGSLGVGTSTPTNSIFAVAGNSYLSGNLGVGTSSPVSKLSVSGDTYISGNTIFGDDSSNTIVFNARAASNFLPSANNTYYLGSDALSWKNIYASGTAYVGDIVAKGPLVDVRAYGAVGNGVTDDTVAIQAAISAASAIGKGIVYLPTGTYFISDSLVLPNGTHVMGAGSNLTTIHTHSAITMMESATVDTPAATNQITIEGIMFSSDGQATQALIIGAESASYLSQNIILKNIKTYNLQNGIALNSIVYSSIENLLITGANTADSYGLKFGYQTQNVKVTNATVAGFAYNWYITGGGVHADSCASYADSTHTNTVNLLRMEDAHNNTFENFIFENISGLDIKEVYVFGNTGASLNTSNNSFINSFWNGTTASSTHVELGKAGNSAVQKTSFINSEFRNDVAVNIEFTSATNTAIMDSHRIAGYTGAQVDPPTTSGTDSGRSTFISGNISLTAGGDAYVQTYDDNGLILRAAGASGAAGEGVSIQYSNQSAWRDALSVTNTPSGNGNLILMPDGGFVGVGTTDPAKALEVIGTIRTKIRNDSIYATKLDLTTRDYEGASNYSGAGLDVYATAHGGIADMVTGSLRFYGGADSDTTTGWAFKANGLLNTTGFDPSAQLVLMKSGNVGIGTTAPSSTLEVLNSSDWFGIGNGTATTTIRGSGTSTFPYGVNLATTGGNVGIGTSNPAYFL
ncbi:hypothetical protein KKB41_03035, partial [Patescibacteria group bacterium]|nr:hypothetical protein [Patescibacteria group bacterium]